MKKTRCRLRQKLYIFFLIILISSFIFMESSLIYQNAAADTVTNTKIEPREYKATANQEMLIIEPNDLKTIDLYFQGGQALEFIFKLYVQEELPIDIWFVNDENYTKFINGNDYNYFIDGSEEQVIFTTKIISLTEYDTYKLILANYNETIPVNVDIVYEGRVYNDYSSEKSSEGSSNDVFSFYLYPFIMIIIILAISLAVLFLKTRRSKQTEPDVLAKTNSKKSKSKNKKKNRSKKNKQKNSKKTTSKKSKSKRSKQPLPEITITAKSRRSKAKAITTPNSFCGYCGQPVTTPFCTGCGKPPTAHD